MLLPPDVKSQIASYLDPLSSFNFGLTCKTHWKLLYPVIQRHAHLFAETPVVFAEVSVVGAHEAWRLLRDILRDPSKGWYITDLSVPPCWDNIQPSTPVEDADLLQTAARALLDLYPAPITSTDVSLVEEIETGVATGSFLSVLAVLIHHLPNLRALRVVPVLDDFMLEDLLARIASEYGSSTNAARLPFKRLRTVVLSHWDDEGSIRPDWVLPFLYFPSLRKLVSMSMGGDFVSRTGNLENPYHPQPRSKIEKLHFWGCQLDAAALEYILSCTPDLKHFRYDAGGCVVNGSLYNAKAVLEALSDHTRHSLETLVMTHISYEEELSFRGITEATSEADLTMFTKLESVSADWQMLWPDLSLTPYPDHSFDGDQMLPCMPLDIRDILPESLKNLQIGGVFDEEEWEGVVRPLETPNEQTPNLTIESINVRGLVRRLIEKHNEQDLVAAVGGWDDRDLKRAFGNGDNAWTREIWASFTM